jgi:ABC-type multidrug transport system ATPase subunit
VSAKKKRDAKPYRDGDERPKAKGPKPALRVTGLVKTYGRNVALDRLDLTIPEGVISGFIGPNGAGKTTTFGVVAGLIQPDSGDIDVLGWGPFVPGTQAGLLTMLPQDCELVGHITCLEYLRYLAQLQGMTQAEAEKDAERSLDEVALKDRARSKIKELSHGMRRRVTVAQALLGDPKLVLLDEPTSGLDPELVVRMRDLFAAQRGKRTLVISSHNLLELEAVCDHVVFIQRGRCVRAGSIAEVTQRGLRMRYKVETAIDLAPLNAAQPTLELSGQGDELVVVAPEGWTASGINAAVVPFLIQSGAGLLEIRQGQSLEDAYLAGQSPPA